MPSTPPPPPQPLPIQDFYNSSLKGKNGWLKQQQQQQQILLEIRYITNYITFLPAIACKLIEAGGAEDILQVYDGSKDTINALN